jgi:site-specific recombinase XerD
MSERPLKTLKDFPTSKLNTGVRFPSPAPMGLFAAWRRVKGAMAAANVSGTPAMPKGLRHAFGVNALQSLVPPHLVRRWLGHASLRITAIYADVTGPEERAFAAKMWGKAVE